MSSHSHRWSRRGFVASTTMGLSALAVGSWADRGSAETKVVNLYNARHYDTDNALYESFTQKTGIAVNLIQGKDDELIERVKSEGANSPADILITVDAGRLWRAEQAGLFQPIASSLLTSKIPASLRSPDNLWFGFSKRARVIMYHKDRVKPSQLSTYEALADPKWKGKILIRSSTNVYNQSLTGSMLASDGEAKTEAWAKGLVANFARQPEGGDIDQIKAVAAGQGDLAISNTYYLARLIKSQQPEERQLVKPIGVFFPNQADRGAHINISGGGVIKTAPHKQAAILFLEHMLSPEAQAIFSRGNNEYPVLAGAAVDPVVAGFGDFKSDALNVATIGRNNPEALKLMDRAGWK